MKNPVNPESENRDRFGNDIKKIISQLGYSDMVSRQILEDFNYAANVQSKLSQSLKTWAKNPNQYLDNPYYDLKDDELAELMNEHSLSLWSQLLLSNPFTILNVEKRHHFVETGDFVKLREVWNQEYYTNNCSLYNSPKHCLELAIWGNNVGGFKMYYAKTPDISTDDIIEIIGQTEGDARKVIKYVIDEKIIPADRHDGLFDRFMDNEEPSVSEINNMFILKYGVIPTDYLNGNFVYIVTELGYANLIKLIIDTRPDLDQAVVDQAFIETIKHTDDIDVVAALAPRIAHDYNFKPVLRYLYNRRQREYLRRFIDIFGIDEFDLDLDIFEYVNPSHQLPNVGAFDGFY